jgi:hypothetical protein
MLGLLKQPTALGLKGRKRYCYFELLDDHPGNSCMVDKQSSTTHKTCVSSNVVMHIPECTQCLRREGAV